VQKHHRIEGWNSWNIEVSVSKWTSVANSHRVCWECLETFSVLIGELKVVLIHCILLESNAKGIEDRIIVLQLNCIRSLLEAKSFFDIYFGLAFDHALQRILGLFKLIN
jgi:hypothetical protein